jgi:hypothetical protein
MQGEAAVLVSENFDGVTAQTRVVNSTPVGGTWGGVLNGWTSTADIFASGSVGGVATVDASANYLRIADIRP